MTTTSSPPKPSIILVGAGPGDPDLLTLAGHRALINADLVVCDRLIPQEMLDICTGEVKVANKVTGKSDEAQTELNNWCLEGLNKGLYVVRLKIGDPFLYGRGGEEVLFYRSHGYHPRIIPGISSALAAPLAANIPLTHRGVCDQVVILTGRGYHGTTVTIPPYQSNCSTIILMGVGRLSAIRDQLILQGYPGNTNVCFVENATCVNERTMRATVETMAMIGERECVKAPAVIIIGQSVGVLD